MPTRTARHRGSGAPLPRTGIVCAAAATALFFAAVGGLPRETLRASGVPTAVAMLSTLVAVVVAGRPPARRVTEALVTAPYALALVAAIGLDMFVLRQGSLPATLVGVLPAAAGVLSWPRTGRRSGPGGIAC